MGTPRSITILGAGIVGVWQAYTLARDGHRVRLVEASPAPFTATASRYAGAMLAPWCEGEAADAIVRDLGVAALPVWREVVPDEARQHGQHAPAFRMTTRGVVHRSLPPSRRWSPNARRCRRAPRNCRPRATAPAR
jgi:glycine/D-amino acid oxidase-like deaminating enzyme